MGSGSSSLACPCHPGNAAGAGDGCPGCGSPSAPVAEGEHEGEHGEDVCSSAEVVNVELVVDAVFDAVALGTQGGTSAAVALLEIAKVVLVSLTLPIEASSAE